MTDPTSTSTTTTTREASLDLILRTKIDGAYTAFCMEIMSIEFARHDLEATEIADAAFAAWERFTSVEGLFNERLTAAAVSSAARYVSKRTAISMAEHAFGATPVDVCFHDGDALRWMPDDDLLILTYTRAGMTTAVVVVRDNDLAPTH